MKWLTSCIERLKEMLHPTTHQPVRRMFPVIFSILALLGASSISSIDSSYIKLSPAKEVVMEGEQFAIEIFAYAHVPVNALDITLEFDPTSIEVLSVDKGQSVLTIWTEEPTVENNKITLGGGTYRRGFLGEHLIATIKAKAKSDGQTTLIVKDANLLAGDGSGTPVTLAKNTKDAVKSFIIYNQNEDPSKLTANLGVGISADIDGDGVVTLKDISSFMAAWYNGDKRYDFNNDTKMNFIDFSIILARSFFRSSN